MNSVQIECFMEVVQCQSFSEASEKLYIAQPTLSKYVKSIEEELELQLIDRSHRKIQLTPEGKLIYEFFEKSATEFSDVVFRAHNLGKGQKSLSVVMLEGLDVDRVLKPLIDYQFFNRDVKISFEQLPSYQIPVLLTNGKYDLAVTMEDRIHSSLKAKGKIKYETVLPGKLNLFYSVLHPVNQLARAPSFADFKEDVFYFPAYYSKILEQENGKGDNPSMDLYADILGYVPKIKVVDSVASILPNLLNGSGVCILGEYCRLHSSPNIKSMVIPVQSDIVYAWSESRETDLIQDIMEYNREHKSNELI